MSINKDLENLKKEMSHDMDMIWEEYNDPDKINKRKQKQKQKEILEERQDLFQL